MFWRQTVKDQPSEMTTSINIWSLKKDRQLKSFLILLIDYLGESEWHVDLSIQTNDQAVYLSHSQNQELRAYLHTCGQSKDRVGLHLEYPGVFDNMASYTTFDELSFPRLVDLLAAHFGVNQVKSTRGFVN